MGFYGFYWVFSIRPHFIDIRSTETARVPPPNLEDALQDASDARDARDARMPRASTTPAPRFSNNPSHSKSSPEPKVGTWKDSLQDARDALDVRMPRACRARASDFRIIPTTND